MISLFKFFTQNRRFSQRLARVSPLLMGAVLLCLPLPVCAAPFVVDMVVLTNSSNSTAYSRFASFSVSSGEDNLLVSFGDVVFKTTGMKWQFAPYAFYAVLRSAGKQYIVYPSSYVNDKPNLFDFTCTFPDIVIPSADVVLVGFGLDTATNISTSLSYVISGDCTVSPTDLPLSADPIVSAIDDLRDQQHQFREQDKQAADQQGSDAQGLVSDLNNLSGKWAILWYPITFTNDVFQAFTGGASTYSLNHGGVSGYRYDDEIGELVPVYGYARDSSPPGGTVLTFPSFSIMGMQVWDSFSFDIADAKEHVPAVFDAIYVIVSILETIWFVGFLRSKYEEVFG